MSEASTQNNILIHKIWRKGRFASFSYWAGGNKIVIDIGSFGDGGLSENTVTYVDVLPFYTYLAAEHRGALDTVFPKFNDSGFAIFGGKVPVARVFKSHWWMTGNNVDKTARVFKCGHFEATAGANGAVIPNMGKPLSASSVKMSLEEIDHVYHRLHALITLRPNILLPGDKDEYTTTGD
jgi:hypothetical protein